MEVELRADSDDILWAVVDLGDAEIVVSDYSHWDDPLDEEGLVMVFEDLQARMLRALAVLGLAVEVSFCVGGESPDSKTKRARERVLERGSRIVVITPELVEQVRRQGAAGKRDLFKELARGVKESRGT